MLQPIFESLRAAEGNTSLCSFPLSSVNVTFGKVDSLLRRTNLPRISVSQCHSVRSYHVKSPTLIILKIPYSQLAIIRQNHEPVRQQLILITPIQQVLDVERHREL